jgi:beta-lactamase regulating signal transducer with metallopeptidase domain
MTQQAISWTLIHFCWQAAAIALVYRIVSWAIARRTSQARYLVSLAALLLMFAAAAVTFTWELRCEPSFASVFPATLASSHSAIAPAAFPRTTAPGIDTAQGHAEQVSPLLSFLPANILSWIDGLWILGVVALSLRSLGGWWIIQRLRSSATAHAPAAVVAGFQRISAALGLRRPVLLRISPSITGPMTVGALRAIVLLPLSAATSLGPEELEVVLAHELAHVRRADFFWNLIQTLAETLFFFHPAVWWISGRIRHERELCCDDLALQVCPNPIAYARALCRLEEQRSRALHLALALDGHQSPQTLRIRICRILGEPMTQMKYRPARPLSLTAACVALIVLVLQVPHLLASLNPPQQPSPAPVIAVTPSPAPLDLHPVIVVDTAKIAKDSPRPSVPVVVLDRASDLAPAAESQSDDKKPASTSPHSDYIDQMKSAGYDVDLDKYIAMKIQNVTPEYAHSMASAGFGKPSADDLVACKMQGITPEYIAQLKQHGVEVKSLQDAIAYHMFQVTPEFAAGMKAAGFDPLTSKQLLALRVQGVTPEYAGNIHRRFPSASVEDLTSAGVFKINDAFIASAEKHGFTNLSLQKLVQLRISGLLDDEAK